MAAAVTFAVAAPSPSRKPSKKKTSGGATSAPPPMMWLIDFPFLDPDKDCAV
jgi:hypothetical protein